MTAVANVRVDVNRAAIRQFLTSPSGPVVREVRRVGLLVLAEAKRRCPVDDGTLRASLDMAVETRGANVTATIGSPLEYALYVHEGTGVYGPRGRPIRPVSAGVLVFEVGGERVFARSVKGMRPRPFLVEALQAASPWPVRVYR